MSSLPEQLFDVEVLDAWDETPELRGVRLFLGELRAYHTAPGQVLKLRPPGSEQVAAEDRHDAYFALASAPSPDGRAELLVKRGHQTADALIAFALPGRILHATRPFGEGFPVGEAQGRDVILFAAGSGISPIRALLQHLVARRDRFGHIVLFYGQRFETEFAYRGEHAAWQQAGVRLVLCCSQPSHDWKGAHGRVHEVARELAFGGVEPTQAVAYLCGMPNMVEAAREELAAAGVTEERTFLNY